MRHVPAVGSTYAYVGPPSSVSGLRIGGRNRSPRTGVARGCFHVLTVATLCVLFATAAAAAEECSAECWFPSGAQTLVDRHPRRAWGEILSKEEYAARAAEYRDFASFIPVVDLPNEGRPLLGLGEGLPFGRKMRGLAFFGSWEQPVLYVDTNGNGDLRDEKPLVFEREQQHLAVLLDTEVVEEREGATERYPVQMKVLLLPSVRDPGRPAWYACRATTRDGTIAIGGQEIRFRLWGTSGLYDSPAGAVWFDLDGDGQGSENEWSAERFFVSTRTVNLGDKSYAFRVDRYGRGIGLTLLAERLPDRPLLEVGAAAPAIRALDVAGRPVELESHRGRVVLVSFWAVGCGPCQAEAPGLLDLERRYRPRGLTVIGVSADSLDDIRAFVGEFKHDWPQVAERDDGPLHKAYRVVAWPRYVLVGKDGRLVSVDLQFGEIGSILDGLLPDAD